MDFGLGLILSFTDKASAGIQGAIVSLNNLQSSAEQSNSKLGALGNALTSLGSLGVGMTAMITAPITAFMGKIVQYGIARASFVEDMHLAFTSLMNDAQMASNYMQSLMNFAKTTPYTYEGITSAAQLLISYGYKADKILTGIDTDMNGILDAAENGKSAFGGILQALGDWAGATGRGEGAMSQVAEIIGKINAEGKVGTMRLQQLQLAGIQASDIIGNMYDMSSDKAAEFIKTMDVDTFINDLVRGIEEGTNGINGMTGAMAGQMMNLKKTWTGAKDTFVSSLKTAGLSLMGMYTDEYGVTRYEFLEGMTSSLNNLSAAVKLIPSILQPLMNTIQNTMNRGSELVLKFAQAWDNLPQPIKTAIGKILGALVLIGPALLVISKVGGGVLNMFATLKKFLGGMSSSMMKFAGTMGLVALMWKTDFIGMRTNLTWFIEQVRQSFATAKDAVSGDVNHLRDVLSGLDKNNFFDNLSIGIMKFMVLFQALKESWSDFTLSEDTFLKAKELGILPLIEAIFDLKYRFDHFKEGFIEGWNEIKEKVTSFISSITEKLKGTFLGDALDKLTGFLQKLTNNDPENWKKAGNTFAYIATGLIALWGAVKLFKSVSKIFGAGKSVGGVISNVLGIGKSDKNSVLSSTNGGFLSNPAKVVKTMGSIAIILGGATVLFTALGAFISIPTFKQFMERGTQNIVTLFESLIPLISVIGALGLASSLLGNVSMSTVAKGVANIAIILGGMDVIITAIGLLNSIPGFNTFLSDGEKIVSSLFSVLETMCNAEAMIVIGLISAFGLVPVMTVLQGLLNLVAILAGLTLVVSAFGALSKIDGFNDFISTGGDALANLIGQLGKIIGTIIAEFSEAMLSSLPEIGTDIAQFAQNVKPFFDITQDIDYDGVSEFVSALSALLFALTAENIVSFFAGDVNLANIGLQLSQFAYTSSAFFNAVSQMRESEFTNAERMFKALSGLNNLSFRSDGLLQSLTGELSLANVGEQLSSFSTKALTFFTDVDTITESSFSNAERMFQALAGLDMYEFKNGGVAQFATGSLDLANVGSQLSDFAMSSKSFFTSVAEFPESGFINSEKVFAALDGISAYSFKSGGIAQLATGEFKIYEVGRQLSDFSYNAKIFFSDVSEISETGFNNTVRLFEVLDGIGDYDFKSGGIAQWFTGSTDFSEIGLQLSAFAVSIGTFFDIAKTVSDETINHSRNLLSILSNVGAYQSIIDAYGNSFGSLSDIGEDLSSFAIESSAFWDISNNISDDIITRGLKTLNVIKELNNIPNNSVVIGNTGAYLNSFVNDSAGFFELLRGLDDTTISHGSTVATMIGNLITSLAVSMKTAVNTNFTEIKNTISEVMESALNNVVTSLNSMKDAFANTRFSIPQHNIAIPHFTVSGSLNATSNPPSVPNFNVSWYKQGGVFDTPSIIGVGEQGREAVMPLERNTAWIGMLAQQIGNEIASTAVNLRPVNTQPLTRGYDDNRYVASGNSGNTTYEGSTDNSVVFQAGAIQINCQNTSDEEAIRMAKKIMALIKRQHELDQMTVYA